MLKSIGVEAFKGCDFKEITIPEGVTVIGDEAFATCESLEYVSLPDSMETLHNGLFSGCGKLKSIKLPRNLKIIRDYCFAECILLENMEFPNSLYYLGDFALSKTGVKNIIIPDSFTELGKSVFYGCTDLESISIQNNKLRIGGSLFYNCSGLKKVIYGSVIVPEKTTRKSTSPNHLYGIRYVDNFKFGTIFKSKFSNLSNCRWYFYFSNFSTPLKCSISNANNVIFIILISNDRRNIHHKRQT